MPAVTMKWKYRDQDEMGQREGNSEDQPTLEQRI
jgi:hypothetical protein